MIIDMVKHTVFDLIRAHAPLRAHTVSINPLNSDAISMRLLIAYFKGSQVEFFEL